MTRKYLAFVLFPYAIREGGLLMTGGSRSCITVSTLAEAEFFCNGGYDGILYAYPITADKIARAKVLHKKLSRFHILVDNSINLNALHGSNPTKPWSVFLEVDMGYNRSESLNES